MMEDTPGTLYQSQEESDSFKGQMEARYRERTELGLVLPDKSSANHQASSEKCPESTNIQIKQDSKKAMDADFEVSSILAKRPAMKELITRFESRGSKKSVSQPIDLEQGPSTCSVSEFFKVKSSKTSSLSPNVISPQNVQSLDGLPVRNVNKSKDEAPLSRPITFLTESSSLFKTQRDKSKDKNLVNDNDKNHQTSTCQGDGAPKSIDHSVLTVKTTNIRNIAGLKGKPNKEDRYTVHKKEWNKGIESPKLNTVPPAGTSKLSPRTSTPKPDRKKFGKFDRPRIPRVKSFERPRPQSVASKRTDAGFPPPDNAPCTSLSLASHQENRSRTPTNTQERIFKRSIIKEAKKLKSNDSPTDGKKSTAMERYFKFLKSTTPPPTTTRLGSQSSISVAKVGTTSSSLKIPAASNSYDTIAKWRNSKTTRSKIRSRSQSPSKKEKNLSMKKPVSRSPSGSRGPSPTDQTTICKNKSPWSATVSPRMTPIKGQSPGVSLKDNLALNPSPMNQEKHIIPSTYTSSIDIGADKSQETQISLSFKDDHVKKSDILIQPLEGINDTISDCSLDEEMLISTDPTIKKKIEHIEVKRLINSDQLLHNTLANDCATSTSAHNMCHKRNSEFESNVEENPIVRSSYSDTHIAKKECHPIENSYDQDSDSFMAYPKNDVEQRNSNKQLGCATASHFQTVIDNEYLDPEKLSPYMYSDALLFDSNLAVEKNNLTAWKPVSEVNNDFPSALKQSQISDSFTVKCLLSESPVSFVKEKASAFMNTILKTDELHDNDLLPPYIKENNQPKMQISENSSDTITEDNDSYLINLKMKALNSLKWFQRNTNENEPETETFDNNTIPHTTANMSNFQYGTNEKSKENQELYENLSDVKPDINMPGLIHGEQSPTSVHCGNISLDHDDDRPSLQDAEMIRDTYVDVIEAQARPTSTILPSQVTPSTLDLNKESIGHKAMVIDLGNGSVAYHFGITNSEIQPGDNDAPLKNSQTKKKKKTDKPEQPDKLEKQKTAKKVKIIKQKSITDASSDIFVIKKTKKKKKVVPDQQQVKQAPPTHEVLVAKPLVNKKKVKKEHDEKSSHEINLSVSQEIKGRAVKSISPKPFPSDKSPPRVYSSLSSTTSLGSLNSIKHYHSPFNSSIVNHPNIRRPQSTNTTWLTYTRPVRPLSSQPSENFPIWSHIPVAAVTASDTVRPPLSVATCHRRWREDYTDEDRPSRIPLTKAFSATLDNAVLNEWTMHSWCQASSPDDTGEKSSLWSSVKIEDLMVKSPSDGDRKMRHYCISRIIFIIIAALALGASHMLYSLHAVDENGYSYECMKGDEICEAKDDISMYVDDL